MFFCVLKNGHSSGVWPLQDLGVVDLLSVLYLTLIFNNQTCNERLFKEVDFLIKRLLDNKFCKEIIFTQPSKEHIYICQFGET